MYSEVGRLTDEAIQLQVRLAENAALLTVAIGHAWATAWQDECQQIVSAMQARMDDRARTNRLIRRDVPAVAAARGLRAV